MTAPLFPKPGDDGKRIAHDEEGNEYRYNARTKRWRFIKCQVAGRVGVGRGR